MLTKFSQSCQNFSNNGPLHFFILTFVVVSTTISIDLRTPESPLTIFLIAGMITSSTLCNLCIPFLRKVKIGQRIRQSGPMRHYSKANTPTMGGLFAILSGLIVAFIVQGVSFHDKRFFSIYTLTIIYLFIGYLDDWKSLNKNSSIGLSPRGKLLLQSLGAMLFMLQIYQDKWINTQIDLPFFYILKIGIFIWPLILFIIIAESNSTNLTDGLDGLLTGCGIIVMMGLILHLILHGGIDNIRMASFSISLVGAWLGFLSINRHPARIFMGDTGSLALGVSIASIALFSNLLWPLFLMGGIFLVESISVITQISLFKLTKIKTNQSKRLFRMAPLHHHFELGGAHEARIVSLFWIISLLLVMISLLPNLSR